MNKYTQLSPEMQELWESKMKEFKKQLATMNEEEIRKEYKCVWMPNVGSFEFDLKYFADEYDKQPNDLYSSSIDTQITNLKSQLKHCKNPLQKLNLEREMNRLIREKGMRENYG